MSRLKFNHEMFLPFINYETLTAQTVAGIANLRLEEWLASQAKIFTNDPISEEWSKEQSHFDKYTARLIDIQEIKKEKCAHSLFATIDGMVNMHQKCMSCGKQLRLAFVEVE